MFVRAAGFAAVLLPPNMDRADRNKMM